MAEINSIQLPSGTSYDIVDGIHMPGEATTATEFINNAIGAGDNGLAVFGVSASALSAQLPVTTSSIAFTKYLEASEKIYFTIISPGVANSYIDPVSFVGSNIITGYYEKDTSLSVPVWVATLTYEDQPHLSDHIGMEVLFDIDEFISAVTYRASVSTGTNSLNQNRVCLGIVSGDAGKTLGATTYNLIYIYLAYTQASDTEIHYILFDINSTGNNNLVPTIKFGRINKTTKAVTFRYSQWYDRPVRFQNVAIAAGTNTTLATVSDSRIFNTSIVLSITPANTANIKGALTWTTAAGELTITGTASAATTAEIILEVGAGA